MGLKIVQVDAFTETPFTGNPAAVCVLPAAQDERWMQNIARDQHFSLAEQNQLLEDLEVMIRQRTNTKPLHSILELDGLGKEIWKHIDADQHIQQERDLWNG